MTPVSEHAAKMAIRWREFLEAHAQRVYAADVDKDRHRAHALSRRIFAGDVSDKDAVRDVYRHHWMLLKNPEDVYAALSVLERLHWVRIQTEQTGGRSRDVIRINPAVTDEKFFPFTQVPGAKSAKSPANGVPSGTSGTSGTWHPENDAEFFSLATGGEEEKDSEKALLVPTDKSAKRDEDTPSWWDNTAPF